MIQLFPLRILIYTVTSWKHVCQEQENCQVKIYEPNQNLCLLHKIVSGVNKLQSISKQAI